MTPQLLTYEDLTGLCLTMRSGHVVKMVSPSGEVLYVGIEKRGTDVRVKFQAPIDYNVSRNPLKETS